MVFTKQNLCFCVFILLTNASDGSDESKSAFSNLVMIVCLITVLVLTAVGVILRWYYNNRISQKIPQKEKNWEEILDHKWHQKQAEVYQTPRCEVTVPKPFTIPVASYVGQANQKPTGIANLPDIDFSDGEIDDFSFPVEVQSPRVVDDGVKQN